MVGLLYGALTEQQLLSLWHNGTEGSKMNPDLTVFNMGLGNPYIGYKARTLKPVTEI